MQTKDSISYPMIAKKNWWLLRRQFSKAIPTVLSPEYVSNLLGISSQSASSNIIVPFKVIGLIDSEMKPTDRAVKWRDNDAYSAVCEEILSEVYPQELRELFIGPEIDRKRLERWFQSNVRVGENAATKMASFYSLLHAADLNDETDVKSGTPRAQSKVRGPRTQPRSIAGSNGSTSSESVVANGPDPREYVAEDSAGSRPSLHVDIQIHISSDATAEQIDQVFASMAKHLYSSRTNDES